ncbi:MAG: sensor domain-containing diguanylate cyclase [Acholeplasmataceae bacterium]|jgi:diguanylate cyclase (GGDEF)-like protein/PAS domain S-box-containing protein|nr:sensor domain-containing diguanylate cyclase [Acholeplasmataceae bacterium]
MRNLEVMKRIFDVFHEAVYIVDKERKILYFNPVAEKISGFKKGEIEGQNCYHNTLNHVDEQGKKLCLDGCPLLESIRNNITTDNFVYLHHKEGFRVRVHVRSVPLMEDGVVTGAIEVFTDETRQNLVLEELIFQKELSLIDPLTGLFNRRYLDERFYQDFKETLKTGQLGVLFIDLDDFKKVNDIYGHLVGDEILKTVSSTIIHNLRESDYVFRYGGEEIVVFLKDVSHDDLFRIAEKLRILTAASSTRNIEQKLASTISVGATMFEIGESIYQAIHRADKAMYQAKRLGKNQTVVV